MVVGKGWFLRRGRCGVSRYKWCERGKEVCRLGLYGRDGYLQVGFVRSVRDAVGVFGPGFFEAGWEMLFLTDPRLEAVSLIVFWGGYIGDMALVSLYVCVR